MHRLLYLLLIPLIYYIIKGHYENKKIILPVASISKANLALKISFRLKNHSVDLLNYAKQKGYNTNYAFLVDMKQSSGSNRFFVYDLKNDTVLKAGLVTHGYGASDQSISFSNVPGSYCTSLGKYKIGKPYKGHFGLAYKLYGLDSSNNNAINRYVVLHSHACVPSLEVAPQNICMSQGCPTVSPSFLTELKTYLDKAEKPILLYIFH
jgi:hypothetical protein